jgi:Fic family protein
MPDDELDNGMRGSLSDVKGSSTEGISYNRAMSQCDFGLDLTPLLAKYLNILESGLNELAMRLRVRREEIDKCKHAVNKSEMLNFRQKELVNFFLDNPRSSITASMFERQHGIAASTAYSDLHRLVEMGLLMISVMNNTRTYFASQNMEKLLIDGSIR